MSIPQAPEEHIPIACTPNAIPAEQQEEWRTAGKAVYAAVEEVADLPNGFRFRLPANAQMLMAAARYISTEHLCCPFLHFTLDVAPNNGPIWLALTGGPGVKDYISSLFASTDLLNVEMMQAIYPHG